MLSVRQKVWRDPRNHVQSNIPSETHDCCQLFNFLTEISKFSIDMSKDLESFLESTAEHRNSLFTRDPSVLSITMKLFVGTTNLGHIDDSVMILADEALKSYDHARNDQHVTPDASDISYFHDESSPVISSEELDLFLNRSVATVVNSSSSFLNATEHHKFAAMDGIGKGKRTLVENAANSILDEVESAQIHAASKFLSELTITDSSLESIQYTRLDILATRSGITGFADSHREKFNSVGFLQAAFPVL